MEVELSTKSAAAVCLKSGQPASNATVISSTQQSAAIPSSGNNFKDYSMSDKLTSLMVSSMLREPPAYHSRHHRTHNKDENEEIEDDDEEEDEEDEDEDFGDIQFFHQHHRRQLMLQQQQQQKSNVKNNSVSSFLSKDSEIEDANGLAAATNSIPNALLSVANFNFNGSNSSNSSGDSNLSQQENPFVFPDNVMEYGEPQFFPGNCVGYLETILEETDEEYEEEEGCSGRHWWTADSDTDTDSVIRVDPTAAAAVAVASSLINPNPNYLNGKSKSAEEPLISLNKSPFRTSASSRPFELEDLHLLDQLDLAFEETLMEPRRRTGFAFGHQLHLLEQSLVTAGKNTSGPKEIAESIKPETKEQGDISNICTTTTITTIAQSLHTEPEKDESVQIVNDKDEVQVEDATEECLAVEDGSKVEKIENTFHNNECDASGCSSESSEAPAEIAEEDFFYSSPSEGSEEEESNHSTTEEETSSSDDSDKNGVVLAEFSLNSAGNGLLGNDGSAGLGAATGFNLGLYGSGRHSNRRAFESQSSRLRSFRSFDSLNSLAGTELLFSKAETFPSFHYIKEVAEPGCSGDVPGAGSGESQSLPLHHSLPHNSSEEDCFAVSGGNKKISKKNSSSSSTSTSTSTSAEGVEGMSTENLSEDSGIGTEGSGLRNLLPLQKLQGSQNPLEDCIIGGSSSNIVTSGVVGVAVGSIGNGTCCDSQQQQPQSFSSCSSANEYIAKSEFALNPFVYSSLSDQETSMSMTSVNNPSTCPSDPDFNGYNNNNSSLDSNLDKSARPPPPSLFHLQQPFLSEKEEEGKENHSENNHNTTHSSNKTDTAINTGSLIEEKAGATDISSESMQTHNKPAFIHSDSCGAVGTSGNSYSSEEQTNVAKDCKANDGILPECGLHPQSTTFHSNLKAANVHTDSNKTNNLPELLQQSQQPCKEPDSLVNSHSAVTNSLPLLLQNLFVEQQEKLTVQPPDLLPAVHYNMEIQQQQQSERKKPDFSHFLNLDNGVSCATHENKPEVRSVGVGGVPHLEQPLIHHKNFNEISSSGAAPLTLSTASLSSPTSSSSSSSTSPSGPHQQFTTPTDTQLTSSLESDTLCHNDQELYDEEVNQNHQQSDTETLLMLPSATTQPYEPYRRERSNSESEFESVESSIEEEDSQSQSVTSILYAADGNEVFGEMDECVSNPNMNSNTISSVDCTQGAVPPSPPPQTDTETYEDINTTHYSLSTTSTSTNNNIGAVDVNVNTNNANGKSGPMSTLGCGSAVVGAGARSSSNSSGTSCTDTTNVDNSHNNESENIKDDDGHTNANPSNNSNNSIERQPPLPPPLLPRRNMRILQQQNHGLQQQQDEVCNNNSVPPPTFSSPPLPQRRPMETTSYLLSASTVVVDSSELPSSLSTTSSPSSSSTISTSQCKGESKLMVVAADVCAENGEQQPSRSVTLDASSCADVHHHHHHPVSAGAQIQEPKQPTATITTTTSTTSSNASETTTTAVVAAAVVVDTTSIELNSSQSDSELSGKRSTARAALASFSSLNSAGSRSTVQKAQQPSSSCSSEVHESISGFSNFGKATDSVSLSPSCHSNCTGNASGVCRESDSVQLKDDGGKVDGFYVQVSSTASKASNIIVGNGKQELKSSEALPVAGETCKDLLDTNEHLVDVEDIQCGSGIVLTCSDNSSVPKGAFALTTDKGSVNQEEVDGEVVLEWGNNHVAHPDVVVDVKKYREVEEEQRDHYLLQQAGDSDKARCERVRTFDNNMEIGHRRSTSPCATNNTGSTGTTANSTIPIPLKTYGARNEVEVFLVSSRETSPSLNLNPSLRLPSTAQHDAGDQEEGKEPPAKVSKSRVHFSPVVSEISWRESYIDQSSDFSGSSEDLLTKLEAFEADLHNNGAIGAGGGTSCGGGGVGSDDEQVTTGSTCLGNYNSLVDKEPVITSGLQQVPQAPVVIHKVQMTSSLLHGGEDEEEDDGNHRNEIDDANTNVLLPIHMVEDDDGRRPLMCTQPEEPTTEIIEFRKLNGNITSINTLPHGDTTNIVEDPSPVPEMIYEDVNVEIDPVVVSPPSTLSMVPDLLTQCENANNSQTHIDIRIEENPIQSQPTKQILPKMFAEKGSEGKNNSLTSLTSSSSSKQKKATKGFSIQGLGPSAKKSADKEKEKIKEKERIKEKEKAKEKEKEKLKEKESEAAKENSGGKTKVGFFERLSKIRLSGGSKSKNKQKIHPKSDNEPQSIQDSQSSVKPPLKIKSSNNAVNGNGAAVSNENNKLTSPPPASSKTKSPILKKAPANSPTPIIPSYNSPDMGGLDEPDQAPTEAFDNILEEIAGLKTIKMRQDKKNNQKGSLSPRTQSQSPTQHQTRSFAERKQFYSATETECPSPKASNGHGRSLSDLDTKLSQFKEDTSRTLDQISKSHPDLEVIEDAVKQHSVSASPEPRISYPVEQQTISSENTAESKSSPKKSEAGQKNEREWYKLLKSAAEKYYYRGSSSSSTGDLNKSKNFKTGIVETDLDTGASREMLDEEILELEKVPSYTSSTPSISTAGVPTSGVIPVSVSSSTAPVAASPGTAAKARSLTNLSSGHPLSVPSSHSHHHHQNGELQGDLSDSDERAKSLEFLLDENHKSSSVPPENKLRLENRQLSEHELRIQRSLQRLNVPEWYKKHEAETLTTTTATNTGANSAAEAQSGGKQPLKLLTRRTDYGSASGLAGGWAGLSAYKTPSLSSLHSSNGGRYSGSLNRSNFVRGRPVTMSATRSSRESLLSPSPASQSPSAFDRCSFTYGMPFSLTRFGHGRLSNHSTSISPASTPDSSLLTTTTTNSYVKKPYLGWRSQERLNAAAAAAAASTSTSPSSTGPKLSIYLPPAERLANEILVARTKNLVSNKPTGNDRPPLPKPPPRAEKTALTPTTPTTTTNINPTVSTLHTFSSPNNHPTSSSETSPQTNSTTVAPTNNALRDDNRMKRLAPDVHDSIREVTKAINQFVEYGEEEQPKPKPRQKSGKKPAVWMESSFVGRKPL